MIEYNYTNFIPDVRNSDYNTKISSFITNVGTDLTTLSTTLNVDVGRIATAENLIKTNINKYLDSNTYYYFGDNSESKVFFTNSTGLVFNSSTKITLKSVQYTNDIIINSYNVDFGSTLLIIEASSPTLNFKPVTGSGTLNLVPGAISSSLQIDITDLSSNKILTTGATPDSSDGFDIKFGTHTSSANTFSIYTGSDGIYLFSSYKYAFNCTTLKINGDLEVFGFIESQEGDLTISYLAITDWNMDTVVSKTVALGGITASQIHTISASVNDDFTESHKYDFFNYENSGTANRATIEIIGTNVILNRLTGGIFDNSSYSASGPRGWVRITHSTI